MKRLFFAVAVALLATLSFTSCEKMIVSSDQTIDLAPKATISGFVLADLNLQSAGLEAVPTGTELLVEVNYADINVGSAGKWMDTVQVSADGKYSVQVPADANGVNVKITPFYFEADQKQSYTESANYSTIKKIFDANPIVQAIRSGQSLIKDITYIANDLPTFAYKVKLSGNCTANLNAETAGNEKAPDGTVLIFYTNDWADSVTITNGKYAINVPNKRVYYKSKFSHLKRVLVSGSYQNIGYEYEVDASYIPSAPTNTLDINFGEGTPSN